jgi:hypothetical protein
MKIKRAKEIKLSKVYVEYFAHILPYYRSVACMVKLL